MVEFVIEIRLPFLIVNVVSVFLQFHCIQFLCKFLHSDKPDGRMQQMNKIHSFAIRRRLQRVRFKCFQTAMSFTCENKIKKSADSRALLIPFYQQTDIFVFIIPTSAYTQCHITLKVVGTPISKISTKRLRGSVWYSKMPHQWIS